jgi:hypothetical protein
MSHQILRNFEFKHYAVVTGDEDNTFTPLKEKNKEEPQSTIAPAVDPVF